MVNCAQERSARDCLPHISHPLYIGCGPELSMQSSCPSFRVLSMLMRTALSTIPTPSGWSTQRFVSLTNTCSSHLHTFYNAVLYAKEVL